MDKWKVCGTFTAMPSVPIKLGLADTLDATTCLYLSEMARSFWRRRIFRRILTIP